MDDKCKCQDSSGKVCGRQMTKEEKEQDGMCCHCADNVFVEMTFNDNHYWLHSDRVEDNYTNTVKT